MCLSSEGKMMQRDASSALAYTQPRPSGMTIALLRCHHSRPSHMAYVDTLTQQPASFILKPSGPPSSGTFAATTPETVNIL